MECICYLCSHFMCHIMAALDWVMSCSVSLVYFLLFSSNNWPESFVNLTAHLTKTRLQYFCVHSTPVRYLVVTFNFHLISRPLVLSCLEEEVLYFLHQYTATLSFNNSPPSFTFGSPTILVSLSAQHQLGLDRIRWLTRASQRSDSYNDKRLFFFI